MTIAACYVLPEGVVVGADSTTTTPVAGPAGGTAGGNHYYDHGQKIFEVGEHGTICIMTWGLGGLGNLSYRTMIAELGDHLQAHPARSMAEVARMWSARVWRAYSSFAPVASVMDLRRATAGADDDIRKAVALQAQQWSAGFCVAGRCSGSRSTEAYHLDISPMFDEAPKPTKLVVGQLMWWGVPQLIERLLLGVDREVLGAIMASGKWTGTAEELAGTLRKGAISIPVLPVRDAADMLYSLLHATVKVIKFSHLPPVCGGPIEVAVVTSDRNFRWIRHKSLDAAIG